MASFLSTSAILYLALISHLAGAAIVSTGQTVAIDGIPYYVPATPFVTLPLLTALKPLASAGGLVPVTVVGASATNASSNNLGNIIGGFGTDDVWSDGFLEGECVRS